jgi:uroporphyrinogen decarboxylase
VVEVVVVDVVVVELVDVVELVVEEAADVVVEAAIVVEADIEVGSSAATAMSSPLMIPQLDETRASIATMTKRAVDIVCTVPDDPLGAGTDNVGSLDPMPAPGQFDDHRFIRACRGLPHERVPVWFMRQAGRSLPEYRAIRGDGTILDAIADPDLSTEITLQPVRRYGVDAAILFSDIVVPAHAVGFGLTVTPGVGPEVETPFRTAADLDRLRPLDPETDTPYVLETVRQLVAELDVPLIGFAGAPFTVASYLIEGRPSRDYANTKALMFNDEPLWHALMDRLADMAIASLRSQIDNGASAIQLFDSWAGALSPAQYERYVLPHSRKVLAGVADTGVPKIHFGVTTGELLELIRDAGADVVGVDWRVPLDRARARLGDIALQGNLDPTMVLAGVDAAIEGTRDVLARNDGHPGHVFNLGHGVMPAVDPDVLSEVVKVVHAEGRVEVLP